jgi:hypothetical protein
MVMMTTTTTAKTVVVLAAMFLLNLLGHNIEFTDNRNRNVRVVAQHAR